MRHAGDLTPKQARFCQEYLVDLNATQAAKRAGYSQESAHVEGCRLLKNARVRSRIAELQDAAAHRNEVSVDSVLRLLMNSYEAAMAAKQHGPAVRAAELLGKTIGMFRDKLELGQPEMSDERLIEKLAGNDAVFAEKLRKAIGKDTFDA